MISRSEVTPNMLTSSADEILGYKDGQQTVHVNPYIKADGLRYVALLRIQEMAHLLRLSKRYYTRGFIRGYFDELNGLAHPLAEKRV